jgi:hypothetical protein
VPHVVNTHVVDAGTCTDTTPEGLEFGEWLAGQGACDNVRVKGQGLDRPKHVGRRLADMHDPGTCLGVRQPQDARGEIDMLSAQRHDLVKPAVRLIGMCRRLWWKRATSARLMSDTRRLPSAGKMKRLRLRRYSLAVLSFTRTDMLAVEAFGQFPDGDRLPPLLAYFSRIAATLHLGKRLDSAGTGLLHRQYAMGTSASFGSSACLSLARCSLSRQTSIAIEGRFNVGMSGYDLTDFEPGVIEPVLPNKAPGVCRTSERSPLLTKAA